jgi:hypothetical protein
MSKVTGIKSIDFKIKAVGHGAVNWNGPTALTGEDGKEVKNHTLPKLRGYSNLTSIHQPKLCAASPFQRARI